MRKPLQLATVEPQPPRGVSFAKGVAKWDEPAEVRNVTHYNIYTPDDVTLERRVPQGQTQATSINSTRVFISSYNSFTQLESPAIMAVDPNPALLGAWNNPILINGSSVWVDATGKLRISSAAPANDLSGTVVGTQT